MINKLENTGMKDIQLKRLDVLKKTLKIDRNSLYVLQRKCVYIMYFAAVGTKCVKQQTGIEIAL